MPGADDESEATAPDHHDDTSPMDVDESPEVIDIEAATTTKKKKKKKKQSAAKAINAQIQLLKQQELEGTCTNLIYIFV